MLSKTNTARKLYCSKLTDSNPYSPLTLDSDDIHADFMEYEYTHPEKGENSEKVLYAVRIGVPIPSWQTYPITTDTTQLCSDKEETFEEYLEAVRIGVPIPSCQTYDINPAQQNEANFDECIPAVPIGIPVLAWQNYSAVTNDSSSSRQENSATNMNIQTYEAAAHKFMNAYLTHEPLPSFRAHNFHPVVLIEDDDSILPLITAFEQLTLKDTVYQRDSHLTVSIFTTLPERTFRKYLSDNGLPMTDVPLFSLGYNCYLYQFDNMSAFKRADSLLRQHWINHDAHTVYLNDLIYLHQSETTILPVQQLRSLQMELSNIVCACRDDEDFIPQLMPPPPPVRRHKVNPTPSPSGCLQNSSALDQQTQHVPPTPKIASKATPFDPSLAIYVARIPPNAMDDLGSMFQAFGRIRRVIPMSSWYISCGLR